MVCYTRSVGQCIHEGDRRAQEGMERMEVAWTTLLVGLMSVMDDVAAASDSHCMCFHAYGASPSTCGRRGTGTYQSGASMMQTSPFSDAVIHMTDDDCIQSRNDNNSSDSQHSARLPTHHFMSCAVLHTFGCLPSSKPACDDVWQSE